MGQSLAAGGAERTEIRLIADLDEPRGYCLDIVGHQARAQPEKGVHAHTCYSYQGYLATDQAFDVSALAQGMLRLPDWNACLTIRGGEESRRPTLASCDGNPAQRFDVTPDGKILPRTAPGHCLGVAAADSRAGGGGDPPHVIRALTVDRCTDARDQLQRWRIPPGRP